VEATDKVGQLKVWATKLDHEIQDQGAKDYLLGLAKNWLRDVQSGVAPASTLVFVEQMLGNAQKAVTDYGPGVRIVGS
jgi:hypothetical protein